MQTEVDHTYGGRPDTELTREQIVDRNLHVVESHFHNENPGTVDKAVALYADNISWEAPSRGVVMNDRDEILKAYHGIFRTIRYNRVTSLRRFATETHVFDDQIGEVTVVGTEMTNLPYPPGTRVNCRLVHLFEMKDGKITSEIAYELWREAGTPLAVDFVPQGSHVEVFDA
jgi:ketosteroid isomerase-like protein